MLIEIRDLGFQMDSDGRSLNVNLLKHKTINTSYILYIFHLKRELTEEDKELLGINKTTVDYYKIFMTDNAVFFVGYDDYKKIMREV